MSTELKSIAGDNTNDEKLLEILLCPESQTYEQITEEHQIFKQNLSARIGVVSTTTKSCLKGNSKNRIIILQKEHPAKLRQNRYDGKALSRILRQYLKNTKC